MTELADSLQTQGIRLAGKLRRRLSDVFGDHIQVILFGSQARGEATEESDFDVLVLLPNLEKRTLDTVLRFPGKWGLKLGKSFR